MGGGGRWFGVVVREWCGLEVRVVVVVGNRQTERPILGEGGREEGRRCRDVVCGRGGGRNRQTERRITGLGVGGL